METVIILALGSIIILATYIGMRTTFLRSQFRSSSVDAPNIDDQPSVSLCIPARNESHSMTACLESALRSNYPKLEIIVLDDESADNTQHLIKAFAHSGVRFIEGSPLPNGWLGKNHALQGLLSQASGSLVLFADVDTRFTTDSIQQMVAYMQSNSVDMISVVPTRMLSQRTSALASTMRQFWNIIGPSRASAASNAWMIRRTVIADELKGFSGLQSAVRPEKAIAALLGEKRYAFLVSNNDLGVSYEKKLSSQYETSVRIYYPDFGLSGILLRTIALYLVFMSYVYVVTLLLQQNIPMALWAAANVLIVSVINIWYLRKLRHSSVLIDIVSCIILPFIIAREILLLIMSVAAYRFGSVTWKGRSVSAR